MCEIEEIKKLKEKIGGYQTSNENYRKKNSLLAAENERLEDELFILKEKNREMSGRIEKLNVQICNLGKKIEEYKAMPWYRRIFAK